MLINLVGAFRYPCAIEKYYFQALRDLGHGVMAYTPDKISFIKDADLTVVVKWCSMPELLPRPRVLIFTDLTTRFQQYYDDIQKHYDYVFLVHNEPLVDNKRIFYLPVAYDPAEHYYIEQQKDIDCLFIGTMHPSRSFLKYISIITRYGNGWGDTHDVYGDEFRNICSQAKIIVNNRYPGDGYNMRDFEAMVYKALVLTDGTPFTPNKDVVLYKNNDDLEQKIRYYLDHEIEREKIAKQAYETIISGKFTYTDRMKEMLDIIDIKI